MGWLGWNDKAIMVKNSKKKKQLDSNPQMLAYTNKMNINASARIERLPYDRKRTKDS